MPQAIGPSKLPTALVFGISGQDGAYLAKFLLDRGYRVVGTSRNSHANTFENLRYLSIFDRIDLRSTNLTDFLDVQQTLEEVSPNEIYNLAGPSSVGLSFNEPFATIENITIGTLNILESLRRLSRNARFYNASSSECFGNVSPEGASECTAFHPTSPYGVAKAAAHWTVANFRESYGLFAVSGILFNHESPVRPERFVTRKIVASACRIKAGLQRVLPLGDLTVQRDWGWAPEYVEIIWRLLQQDEPRDFVVATGRAFSLLQFVEHTFQCLGLDWKEHVESSNELRRPSEIAYSLGDPTRLRLELGWKASYTMPDVVRMMIEAEMARLRMDLASKPT